MAGGRKLMVEVIAAKGLMPKDGEGSANAYCVLDYDGQRKRTRVKFKDLDPTWNQKFEFTMPAMRMQGYLEINVQNENKSGTGRRSCFMGRVVVPMNTVPSKPEAVRWYQLQKRGLFSHVKGDLGIKVWLQNLETAQKGGKNARDIQGEPAIVAGGGVPNGDVLVVGAGKLNKEAKADRVSEGPRPSTITVPEADFTVKETHPNLGNAVDYRQHHDLVEEMSYLFIRVVRARNLSGKDNNTLSDPYVKISVGPVKTETKFIPCTHNPEWNRCFAIGKDKIQGGTCELSVWDAGKISKDTFLGGFMIDLHGVPSRKPPESPLAPQWYRLESKTGNKAISGDLMVSIWWGTQADEVFPEAWHSDTGESSQFRSKLYMSPKLWYLRVNVIEAQDLLPTDRHMAEPYVRLHVGPYQTLRTSRSVTRGGSPFWNEDLLFVAAEPFDEVMHIIVEDRIAPGKEEIIGHIRIPLMSIARRIDGRPVASRWYVLERDGGRGAFLGRIHLRLCFEGGYHVVDESSNYISDTRPTARQLWKPSLGVLEVGIHCANNLLPMKTTKDNRGSTDAYCVVKYGPKWVRTRTIFESFNPRWNEQYTWEVFDPCTVVTVGVFDNRNTLTGGETLKDLPIGKVRIRLSTLESDRVYTNAYPLLVVTPQGVKKMGELEMAVRFSTASTANVIASYLQPQLPRMHFFYPLDPRQTHMLRVAAMNMVALRLMRSEFPLRQEVVLFMLDTEAERWSMRRSKANYYRIMGVLGGFLAVMNWFTDICNWKSPITTVLVHILFLILVWYPELLLPTVFLYMFLVGAWNYRFRSRTPPFMDAKLSQGEFIGHLDELEEEFNIVPANRAQEVLKHRYERLRGVAGRIQNGLGSLASMGERFQSLLIWRDPRATALFIAFCLVAAIVLYVTPFQVVAVLLAAYMLRHPRFRDPLPSVPLSFFKRLPSQSDRIL
ncbi:FT-interacting protein 3 isoform X1 [Physcomitrium patens]|uniref:C2 domain-containing protein n=1 Tax=Physcomitrium patens TaxID=3218 RepID=A0A2K1J7U8_PHYPA|nr:FT-interacting protein 1-like [Physcomitrium patens]PNR37603.1 hypothetical protein PHYPA_020712 [Physcomitrium patens]|eukprot:XP_024398723.1 FT-interacting protein 1-like [Physcomitrella patens]